MKCEKCSEEHDGSYGSGRFCGVKCAKSFSTYNKRDAINQKVSNRLKGGVCHGKGFAKGFDERRRIFSKVDREKAVRVRQEIYNNLLENAPFDELPHAMKRDRIRIEQNGCCQICQNSVWLGLNITLELDHIDGNKRNNRRENLRFLCPNCHSQTPTWRRKTVMPE